MSGQRLAELIEAAAQALREAKAAAQEEAVRARLPWPLRAASPATVRRFPWVFRWWMRRWEIVEDLSTGEWRVQRRNARPRLQPPGREDWFAVALVVVFVATVVTAVFAVQDDRPVAAFAPAAVMVLGTGLVCWIFKGGL